MTDFSLLLYTSEYLLKKEVQCLSVSLEKEIYTPFASVTALFPAGKLHYDQVTKVELFYGDTKIFTGLADTVDCFTRGGISFARVQAKSFSSILTQNELEGGLHSDLTLEQLIYNFYSFPHVTCEQNAGTGYIFVREGKSIWDSIVTFGYKLTGHYPYVTGNHVRISPPAGTVSRIYEQVTESGELIDTTRFVSHFHMEDIEGNPNAYQQTNAMAVTSGIIRHKQIAFDKQFLHNPQLALTFRDLYSRRGCRAVHFTYTGFRNEELGDSASMGDTSGTVCKVRMTYGTKGLHTKIWMYQDGFYTLS